MIIFIMITFSSAIRLFPLYTTKAAKQAAWLSPAVAFIGMLILVAIFQAFFKKGREWNFSDVIFNILGKVLGRIVLFLFLAYELVLSAMHERYYAERMLSSITPEVSIHFLLIVMLALVFYVTRGDIVALARFIELLFFAFIIAFGVISLLALSNVKITNILPVSYLDILPAAKGSVGIFIIWGFYFILAFFFADRVNGKEHIKKSGIQASVFILIVATLVIIITVGTMGQSLTSRIPLPYFVVVRVISILGTLERLESVVLAIWVAADFILISVMIYAAISIIKSFFNLSGTKSLASPVILITYILALVLAKNRFELEAFSTNIGTPVNMFWCGVFPLILFVIGKIRKVL